MTRDDAPPPIAESPPGLGRSVRVAVWGTVTYGAMLLVGAYLAQASTAALAVQAVIAEWGAGRLGITWSDPFAPAPAWRDVAARAAKGAAMAAAAAIAVAAVALVARGAHLAPNTPSWPVLGVGAVVAGLGAMKDELVLHGVVLRLVDGTRLARVGPLACGAASAAAAWGGGAASAGEIAAVGLAGIGFGALWRRDRGAWMPWAAHAAWTWTTACVLRGGVADLRAAATTAGGGDAGFTAGYAALGALAVASAAAWIWSARTSPMVAAPPPWQRRGA